MILTENKDISKAIFEGLNFLKNNQNSNGSICLNNDKTWDIWETVHAILTSIEFPSYESTVNKAICFLLNSQRADYSFHVSSIYNKDQYCMETTPLCALALKSTNNNVDNVIKFILKKQRSNGCWESGIPEIYKKYQDFPSVTGQVIRTLLKLNIKTDNVSKAIKWLIKKQNDDGSWGSHFVYYDSPFYPLHVILESFYLYGIGDSVNYKNAINFIKNTQNNDGSWCYMDTKDRDKPSPEHRTSLALYSLLINPSDNDLEAIGIGIKWLLKKQKSDGRWYGGYFVGWPGKKEDIYATCISVLSLKKYENYIKSNIK